MLSDIEMQVEILSNLRNSDEIVSDFLEKASVTDTYKSIDFDYRKYLTNKHDINGLLKRQPERRIDKLILAFDEFPFAQVCDSNPILDGDQEEFENNQAVYMNNVASSNSENFSTFIGLRKIESNLQGRAV